MKRVLVLDDDPRLRELMVRLLAERGHTCLPAANVDEAVGYLRAGHVDCAVCDLLLPGRSGASFVRELLAGWPGLPVIVVSGALQQSGREAMVQAGVYCCFAKPFDLVAFVRKVEEAMSRRPAAGPGLVPLAPGVQPGRREDFAQK